MPCFLQSVAVYTDLMFKGIYEPELLKCVCPMEWSWIAWWDREVIPDRITDNDTRNAIRYSISDAVSPAIGRIKDSRTSLLNV